MIKDNVNGISQVVTDVVKIVDSLLQWIPTAVEVDSGSR